MLFLGESDEPFQPTKASKNHKLLVHVCDALEDKGHRLLGAVSCCKLRPDCSPLRPLLTGGSAMGMGPHSIARRVGWSIMIGCRRGKTKA